MNLILKNLVCPLFLVLLGAVLFSSAVTVAAYPANQCAADRKGSNLNCTANDVQITGMSVVGDTTSCIGGTQIALDLQAIVNFAVPDRYDIGIFISNNGKSPQQRASSGGAASCAVSVLPVASPFLDLDGMDRNVSTGDICGDGNGSIGGGTGSGIHYLTNVDVRCQSLTGAGGNLYIPFVLSWDNQASSSGALCTSNRDPVPNTTSKCNSPTVTQGSVRVVVLPAITQSDGVTTLFSGSSTNYSIVITNTTGVSLSNAVFTDPAVTGIAVNSLTCVAAGGASCPAGSTVAGMQGSGITIPAMPDGGSVTFTVNATLTGNPGDTRTNSASVTLGSQTNSASDTDTIVGTIAILPTTRSQNGDKDSAVVYTYTLYNFGVIADKISLAAVSGQGWTVTGSPALVTVEPGESKTVTVTVNIPDSASIGTVDTTTLTAVSGNNPSKTATATAVTTVTTVLTLMSNNTSAGGAGSSVYYNHRVQSNASDIKFVSLTPTFTSGTCTGWTSTLYESDKTTPLLSPVKLAASGGYKDFVLKVSIPSNAAASSTCTATLAAKDTSNAANTVSVTDATTVKALVLYQDPGYTTEQYTYPVGNNVYAKSFGLINGTPYYYKWYDPAGVLQRTSPTTSNLVSLPDTYTIPGTGPLGTWTVQLWDATANTIFAQTNFYVGPDHLKAGYTGANPDVNTNTVIDLTLHDKTNHVVPKDASGNLVKGGATDPKDPLIITVTVSGSATIVSTTLTNASIIGQSVTGRLDSTTGTATLTISDSVSETVTVTPHSYNSALYGSPARDEPATVTFVVGSTLNHIRFIHDTSGLTCESSPVTIQACADAGCTALSSLATTITLSPSSGWGTNPVTFIGSVSETLSITTPQTVTLGTSTVTPTPSGTSPLCYIGTTLSDCKVAFADTGLIISAAADGNTVTIPSQVAGVDSATYYLRAVKTSDKTKACVSAITGGNVPVGFAYECVGNPSTCYGQDLMSLNGGSGSFSLSRNNSGNVSSYTQVDMNFDANGNAPFTFNYADVGQVKLWAKKAASVSGDGAAVPLLSDLVGSSNAFVVKPYAFSLTNIKCTTANAANCAPGALSMTTPGSNPAAADASGSSFIQAGKSFSVTVSAVRYDNAQSGNLGAVTPSFGRCTSSGDATCAAARESVSLAATLVAPSGGTGSALGGTHPALASDFVGGNGVYTFTDLSWGEVGIIGLKARNESFLSNDFGTCSTNTVENIAGANCQGTFGDSGNIGRFVPDHFDTTASGTMSCPSSSCPYTPGLVYANSVARAAATGFAASDVGKVALQQDDNTYWRLTNYSPTAIWGAATPLVYSGQPFTANITAMNSNNVKTQNYQGGFAKATTLSAVAAVGGAPIGTSAPGGTLTSTTVAAASFASGNAAATPVFTFTTIPTTPTDVYVRASESSGGDGVTSLRGASIEGGVKVANGRVMMSNAHGSELLPLSLNATVQYYNGTAWVTSATDTVTHISAANFALAFPSGTVSNPNNLAACETVLSVAGTSPNFTVGLSAPGIGNTGWTDLTLNLGNPAGQQCTAPGGAGAISTSADHSWLQFPWEGAGAINPTARATFGIYKGNSKFIYIRELY